MKFLLIAICVCALVFALRNPIKKCPVAFYIGCIVLDVLLIWAFSCTDLPLGLRSVANILMQRGGLGVSLFFVVMFIGALQRNSKPYKWLHPIRAELSIMASILITGHMVNYLVSYLPVIFAGNTVKTNVAVSIALAIVLLLLVLVLGATSFRFVKRHMKAKNWKKLQRFAYLFYFLIFAHMIIMLLPSALNGGSAATISVIAYAVLFLVYTVMRVLRYLADKKDQVSATDEVLEQGFTE